MSDCFWRKLYSYFENKKKNIFFQVDKIRRVIIWGNHSSTQYPDTAHAVIDTPNGPKPVSSVINDDNWLNEQFVGTIQKRGAAVIAARKMSSAMSAAKAAGDHMRDWWHGTAPDQWVSMGVLSDGSYGIPKDMVFSFPVTIKNGKFQIVQVPNQKNLKINYDKSCLD